MPVSDPRARHIVIDGLPQNIVPSKRATFQRHMERKIGELLGHTRFTVHLVTNPETTLVCGAFLSCATESEAEAALAKLNLYHFTKSDVFQTYRFSGFTNLQEEEPEYVPPELESTSSVDQDLVHNMAEDENARPQFLIKGGASMDCEWYWFDWEKNEPVLYRRPSAFKKDDPMKSWSEMDRNSKTLLPGMISSLSEAVRPLPTWSTYGTLVISQHATGLRVWGGRNMHMLYEITGDDISAFMISPSEKYIVVRKANSLSVYNLRTAKKISTLGNLDLHSEDLWPITRFSADDSLCAVCKINYDPEDKRKLLSGKLYIYDSSKMRVLRSSEKTTSAHTFSINGLYKAEWNPVVGTQLAYVSSLGPNHGWKVVVSNIVVDNDKFASEELLGQRNFLSAEKVDMLWHPGGTYLAVKVTLKTSTEFFLFQMDKKSFPVSRLEIKAGYIPERFIWQATGDYAAILLKPSVNKSAGETGILQIYSFKNSKPKLLGELSSPATFIYWAPKGNHLVGTSFELSVFQFIAVHDDESVSERTRASGFHATDLQWDPTGRFCAMYLSCARKFAPGSPSDGHFRIFDFNGKLLYQKERQNFSHLIWRPLPPSLLSQPEVRDVKLHLKEIVKDYERESAEKEEKERTKLAHHHKELDEAYQRKMNDLARKMREQRLMEKREELQNQSIWKRYWERRLKSLPDDEKMVEEEVKEERILSTRVVGGK